MSGQFAAYIIPAYVLSAVVIGGLFVWTRISWRGRLKDLDALEKQGVRRRSSGPANG